MATFGKTAIGGTTAVIGLDAKRVAKFTLAEACSVSKLSVYVSGDGSGVGDQVMKGIIYDDDGAAGAPGTLLGTSNEVTVTDGQAAGWVDLTFASPIALTAGDYHLGLITGANTNTIKYRYDTVVGIGSNNADTYSDGPANPFGTPTSGDREMSIYATYTAPQAVTPGVASLALTAYTPIVAATALSFEPGELIEGIPPGEEVRQGKGMKDRRDFLKRYYQARD